MHLKSNNVIVILYVLLCSAVSARFHLITTFISFPQFTKHVFYVINIHCKF